MKPVLDLDRLVVADWNLALALPKFKQIVRVEPWDKCLYLVAGQDLSWVMTSRVLTLKWKIVAVGIELLPCAD